MILSSRWLIGTSTDKSEAQSNSSNGEADELSWMSFQFLNFV